MTDTTHADNSAGRDMDDVAEKPAPRIGRRKMMLGVAAAGVGASVVAEAMPAGATDGNPVLIGEANTAKATTSVTTTKGNGLDGTSDKTTGVYGVSVAASGLQPLVVAGVWGDSTTHAGVVGTSNDWDGVVGYTNAAGHAGVLGTDLTSEPGSYEVCGTSTDGYGVYGTSTNAYGVYGTSGGTGVRGTSSEGNGVYGTISGGDGNGVEEYATGEGGYGVYGYATGSGDYSFGVVAFSENSEALYVDGDAEVTGTLSKASGSFKIDHPLDPGGKYLYHSFVESPDMKNVYDGTVTLDGDGRATVELPDWFEALNRDYRNQLTAIGDAAPNLRISSKVADGKFSIAGGKAGQEVSWQVTGIRQDAWANANRIPVEVDKKAEDQGRYLHPELFGGEAIGALAKVRKHAHRGQQATRV